jgi:hypothetical protein
LRCFDADSNAIGWQLPARYHRKIGTIKLVAAQIFGKLFSAQLFVQPLLGASLWNAVCSSSWRGNEVLTFADCKTD